MADSIVPQGSRPGKPCALFLEAPTGRHSPRGDVVPQSFAAIQLHIVFSNKNRAPLITPDIAPKLYAYIHGIITGKTGILLTAGGVADHVHLLVTLGRETSVSELVRLVKCNSSGWIHKTFPTHRDFAWQNGYGAFSVSRSHRELLEN
jgi:REP element-mobilizing transposase RayT